MPGEPFATLIEQTTPRLLNLTRRGLLITKAEAGLDGLPRIIDGRGVAETLDWLPCLKKLWLSSAIDVISSLFLSNTTQWARLTVFHLRSPITNRKWRLILRLCPNIEVGWFAVSDDRSYETVTDLPSVPRTLRQQLMDIFPILLGFSATTSLSITLSHADVPDFADFMRKVAGDGSMALPNLQTLELRFMPKFKRWVTSSEDRLTELLKNIAEVRNSTYAARIAVMEENRTHSAQQNGGFRFSICFNWDESDQRFREWALNFNVMHAYFTELRNNFMQDVTPIQAHLRQEKISEASDDYLKDEFLQ
ncbi:hypothetical protein BJ165DRAFT_1406766 [Panaeolus papilionaceus]|nr:hypothetical protein BJ165DRAFT_1406766 [Panaeolus papilionaceus]